MLVKFIDGATPEQKKLWRDEIIILGNDPTAKVTAVSAGEQIVIEGAQGLNCGWEDGEYLSFTISWPVLNQGTIQGAVMTLKNMEDYEIYVASAAHTHYKKLTDHLIKGTYSACYQLAHDLTFHLQEKLIYDILS